MGKSGNRKRFKRKRNRKMEEKKVNKHKKVVAE